MIPTPLPLPTSKRQTSTKTIVGNIRSGFARPSRRAGKTRLLHLVGEGVVHEGRKINSAKSQAFGGIYKPRRALRPQGLVFIGNSVSLMSVEFWCKKILAMSRREGVGVRQSNSEHITSWIGIVAGDVYMRKAYPDAGTLARSCGLPPLHKYVAYSSTYSKPEK